jgi:peptidoglycan hydrolase-like protein with peptidoglycan-binding domain
MNSFKRIAAAVVVATVAFPMISFAQTSDVQSQIKSLLDQIHALQQQLMTLVASSTANGTLGTSTLPFMGDDHMKPPMPPGQIGKEMCITLDRNLAPGSRGDDVMKLQQMLGSNPQFGFNAAPTGVFGPMTAKAMMKFQMNMGIASSSTGIVGPMTRGFFERSCGKGLGNGGDNGGPMKGTVVTGSISASSGSSITVQSPTGNTRVVNITASTTIQVFNASSSSVVSGSISDLIVGKTVLAEGTANSDGSLTAVHIKVGPPVPPKPQVSGPGYDGDMKLPTVPMYGHPDLLHGNGNGQ